MPAPDKFFETRSLARTQYENDGDIEALVTLLRESGCTVMQAIMVVRELAVIDLRLAKSIVQHSAAYADQWVDREDDHAVVMTSSDLAYDRVVSTLVAQVPELQDALDQHLHDNGEILQHVFLGCDVPFVQAWQEGKTELVVRCLALLERAFRSPTLRLTAWSLCRSSNRLAPGPGDGAVHRRLASDVGGQAKTSRTTEGR